MMPLVEHVTGRHRVVVQPAPGRLRHHQSVVADHQFGCARPADRVLDEAAPPVRAGGMDALAAPVGEGKQRRAAEQLGEPAGQVAALDVAVLRRHRPAGDQPERDQAGRREAARCAGGGILQIEQAQIVLPPLAHDHAAAALGRIGEQPGQFAVDLALQMAGEGADPDRALVALGPQAGRRDITQRLAGAGAGLRQHQMRIAALLAWGEGLGGGPGIVGLPGPLLGLRPQDLRQPAARLRLADRIGRRRGQRRRILPFGQPPPDLQRLRRGRRIGPAERGGDIRRPAPAARAHLRGQSRGVAVQRQHPGGGKMVQQRQRDLRQRGGQVLQVAAERIEIQHQRQPARRRRGRAGRHGEGEQFQQVETGQRLHAEPAQRGRRVHQQGRLQGAQPGRDLLRTAGEELAVHRQDRGAAVSGDHRGSLRQQDPRRQRGR